MATGDEQLMQRIIDFELAMYRETSEVVRECEGGYAMLCPSLPLIYDANDVILMEEGISAEEADRIADEEIGGMGMVHRSLGHRVVAEGARLEPGLKRLGWEAEWAVYMVLRGVPDRQSDIEVTEHPLEEIADLRRALIREDLPLGQPKLAETTEQLLEMHRWMGEAGGDRWFVARDDHGNPASACRLYESEDKSLGQVEDVATLREARQRGLARAVVSAAIAASREAGHEHTFIAAVADDWPQLLYARVGFEPVGRLAWFRKKPPGSAGTPSG